MALRNVVKDGDEILKKKCRPVTVFDQKLEQLLDDMGETMMENDGLGLAAPQVGVLRRLFVALDESSLEEFKRLEQAYDMAAEAAEAAGEDPEETPEAKALDAWDPTILEFINPEIVQREGGVRGYEGCLSFPGRFGAVERPQKVKVKAQDRQGNFFEFEADNTMARCMCHETDHLDGITFDTLAEYFYDPETPHDLDPELAGGDEEE